jgi:hypothetical protein
MKETRAMKGKRGDMYGFDGIGVAAASAGVGIGLAALIALRRRKTVRRAAPEPVAVVGEPRRRIDVVAIDEGAASAAKQAKP